MNEDNLETLQKHWPQTLKLYAIGLISCLILTGASFLVAYFHPFAKTALIFLLFGLAVFQAAVQLLCFMHLGKEAKPRWMIFFFYFMFLVLLIIVLGSLWIMHDLDQRVMPEMSADQFF